MKSREFFNEDNTPEDPVLQKARELETGERIIKTEKTPELEAWLDHVDFEVLEQLFKEDIQKTGISPAEVNILRRDRISNIDGALNGGYANYANEILLGYKNIKKTSSRQRTDSYLTFLQTLTHEESHAVSKTRCWNLLKKNDQPVLNQSGYSSFVSERTKSGDYALVGKIFELFNEGVTEKISLEVMEDYLRRTSHGRTEDFVHLRRALDKSGPYNKAMQLVSTLTQRIGAMSDISEKAAWDAIKRGYYEGEDLLREDFQEWFAEILPPNFMDKLMMADEEDLTELLKELEEKPFQKAA